MELDRYDRAILRFLTLDELVAVVGREGELEVKESGAVSSGYFVQAVKVPPHS